MFRNMSKYVKHRYIIIMQYNAIITEENFKSL